VWGIIPAAGAGTRIQPLAFSKELLPVGSRVENGVERPRAVSEYLVERMVRGGATRVCFVVSPGKADILAYYGGSACSAHVSFTVQPQPAGLCDALFRALPMIPPDEPGARRPARHHLVPRRRLPPPARRRALVPALPRRPPEYFDAVVDHRRRPRARDPGQAARADVAVGVGRLQARRRTLRALHDLWLRRDRTDEYVGTLVNAWLAEGNTARGVRAGETYVDVGTLNGYREAITTLGGAPRRAATGWGFPAS
jgi:hypothetical protein